MNKAMKWIKWGSLTGLGLMAAVAIAASGQTHADADYVLKIGTVAPSGTPWSKQVNDFKNYVKKASGGRIKVKVFMGGSLGGEKALVRRTSSGSIQAYAGTTAVLATKVKELGVLEAPYLFDSAKQAHKVLDSDKVKSLVSEGVNKKGFQFGFWSENGFRSWFTKDKMIKVPADMKGLRMRSQESQVHLEIYKALGAKPVALDITSVLTSLQTDAVDGFDNTPLFATATSLVQAVKYLTLSKHTYQPGIVVYSKKWFDSLPADLQKVLAVVPESIVDKGRSRLARMESALVKNIKNGGIKVHKPSASERAAFKKKTSGVAKKVSAAAGSRGKNLLKAINAAK